MSTFPRSTYGAAALLVLTASACGSQAPAPAPWVRIVEGAAATAYVDTSRISVRGGVADVWFRFDYAEPDLLPDSSGTFQRVDMHQRVECAARRVDDLAMELRDSTGKQVGAEKPSNRWRTFDVHPFGKFIYPAFCKALPELTR